MKTYFDLLASINILKLAAEHVAKEQTVYSPAWTMLCHAQDYLSSQANAAMRGNAR